MELDFDKYCKLKSWSPNTVLPPLPRRSKAEKRRSTKKEPIRTDDLLKEDFTDINFHRFRSISCKNVQARSSGIEKNEILRRGSVYQSSTERRHIQKIEEFEGRKKIELSGKDSIFSSYAIVDALCSSDEDISEMKRSSIMSKNSELSSEKVFPFDCGRENFVLLEKAKNESSQIKEKSNGLHKSLSAKLVISHSPSPSESDKSRHSSAKTRFGPISKMFDSFTKSKSLRAPLGASSDSIVKNDTFRKSLMSDFSKPPKVPEIVHHESIISCSPAHLQGCLKLESKRGAPFFEFSLKSSDDILVAKRWKTEDGLNWVYTFHNFPNKRKSNTTTQWESKDLKKASSLVGKMQVSCCLDMEMKKEGSFGNSMMTEFVLFDVTKPMDFDSSDKKYLEIAAAVVQFPYGKKESLLNLCKPEEMKSEDSNLRVNIVVPSGTHCLPNADMASCGPSSLLERWRSGGACDCGGWDMGCSLNVFGNTDIRSFDNRIVLENQEPLELFAKGGKDNTPTLVITAIDKERYTIDFHAKLSALQAFSLCVAILHCTEASINTHEREKRLSKSDSLRVFVEEEISDLLESITEEEKREEIKKIEEFSSFKIVPPFSPMSRV